MSGSFEHLVDAALTIEKARVASQVRKAHLEKNDRRDPDTEELLEKLIDLEAFVDGRVADRVKEHPAYPWFSRVKGIGLENIPKVLGMVDIEKVDTVSSLWMFAGYAPENGKAMKRVKGGGKLHYNSRLRTMCWRVAGSLLRARGKFYDYYVDQKERYTQSMVNRGVKIVPAAELPKKDGKHYEPEGMISEGHLHNMALRKMIKLFLACLALTWREAIGKPLEKPYAIEQLKHSSFIKPEEMADKP